MTGEDHAPTSSESEFERLCGTLGEIGETRMPVEADLVRGEAAGPRPAAICGPLPEERNHQDKQNRLLVPLPNRGASGDHGIVRCKERLGGLLKYYEREAGMSLRSGKLPFLGSEDEFLVLHKNLTGPAYSLGFLQ